MPKKYLGSILMGVIVFVILFNLSTFSELEPQIKCYIFEGSIANPAGAQPEPLCGQVIYGKGYIPPIFPFKEKTNERAEFCRKNIKSVENSCGFQIDQLIFDDHLPTFDGFFGCKYLVLSKDDRIEKVLTITKFAENYSANLGYGSGTTSIKINNSIIEISSLMFLQEKQCRGITNAIIN
jgi:hypothetical protein